MQYFEYFTQQEVRRIHETCLRLLETVGVDFGYAPAVEVLKKAGCRVEGQRVYFPPKLVETQIAKAPARCTLHARNPEKNVVIGGEHTVFVPCYGPPCAIDSPDPAAIEAALKVHRGTALINSISLEQPRYENLLPILAGTDLKVIALCMSDAGMPQTVADRLKIADGLVNGLSQKNVTLANIFVDPLVQPMSVDNRFGVAFLDSVEQIMTRFKGIHTACGLSNISFGLPARPFLSQTFMVMAIAKGLDGAIVNPLDKQMMANITAAEALVGKNNYCMKYLKAYRAGAFER